MTFDRKDFEDLSAHRKVNRELELMPLHRMLQAAAPIMASMVTGSDAWDKYLAILQGFVDQAKNSKLNAESRLAAPDVWEHGQLMKLKADILTCNAMIEAWTVAMQLPKALIEGGEIANTIVAQFEAKHASTAEKALP